jgi:hypothetical protein
MAQSFDGLINYIHARIHRLLYDEVIEHTIVVMRELSSGLSQLNSALGGSIHTLTPDQQQRLRETLLPLTSESIREALHKGELSITNGIIRHKNRLLELLGEEIPESHREINPHDYPNYNW